MKYKWLNFKFWIITIFTITFLGSIAIIIHGTNRVSNLISLNASLTGGLVTLISVSITNRYYNEQKIKQEKENKIEQISIKLNALKFLKEEVNINRIKFKLGYSENERFQTIIWEEYRKEFVEIFINNPESELFNLNTLFVFLMQSDNCIVIYKTQQSGVDKLFGPINISIDEAIDTYKEKLINSINENLES